MSVQGSSSFTPPQLSQRNSAASSRDRPQNCDEDDDIEILEERLRANPAPVVKTVNMLASELRRLLDPDGFGVDMEERFPILQAPQSCAQESSQPTELLESRTADGSSDLDSIPRQTDGIASSASDSSESVVELLSEEAFSDGIFEQRPLPHASDVDFASEEDGDIVVVTSSPVKAASTISSAATDLLCKLRKGLAYKPVVTIGETCFAQFINGQWYAAAVESLRMKDKLQQNVDYARGEDVHWISVKFLVGDVASNGPSAGVSIVQTPEFVAPCTPLDYILKVGARMVAKKDDNCQPQPKTWHAGIVAEEPSLANECRYLIFFDDGYVQYARMKCVFPVLKLYSKICLRDIRGTDEHRKFIEHYLANYPERDLLHLSLAENVQVKVHGDWLNTKVVAISGSMAKVEFMNNSVDTSVGSAVLQQAPEWIYRGSTRLRMPNNALQASKERMKQTAQWCEKHGRMPGLPVPSATPRADSSDGSALDSGSNASSVASDDASEAIVAVDKAQAAPKKRPRGGSDHNVRRKTLQLRQLRSSAGQRASAAVKARRNRKTQKFAAKRSRLSTDVPRRLRSYWFRAGCNSAGRTSKRPPKRAVVIKHLRATGKLPAAAIQPAGNALPATNDLTRAEGPIAENETWTVARQREQALMSALRTEKDPRRFEQLKRNIFKVKESRLAHGKSKIHNEGVFAKVDLSPGEWLCEYRGELITQRESERRERKLLRHGITDTYQCKLDNATFVDARGIGKSSFGHFINHSCQPNCKVQIFKSPVNPQLKFILVRANCRGAGIPEGTELTMDYKITYEKGKPRMPCNCRSANCRHFMDLPLPGELLADDDAESLHSESSHCGSGNDVSENCYNPLA